MLTAKDYPVTQRYGYDPSYPLNNGNHRGTDYGCPAGTAVVVNGITIGYSGASGRAYGDHLHVGKFSQNGTPYDPGREGFTFSHAKVITVAEDATNGKYVRILGDTYQFVYCHLSKQSVSVGQVLTPPPVTVQPQGEPMIQNTTNEWGRWAKLFIQVRGRTPSRAEFEQSAVGRTWLNAIEILCDDRESDRALHAQEVGLVAVRDGWEGQIHALQALQAQTQARLDTLTSQLEAMRTDLSSVNQIVIRPDSPTEVPSVTHTEGTDTPHTASQVSSSPSWFVKLLAAVLSRKTL